jgi:hypothetical protein
VGARCAGVMLERLGDVIYWAACAIAISLIGVAGFYAIAGISPERWWSIGAMTFIAMVTWLVGRAIQYVFAGH